MNGQNGTNGIDGQNGTNGVDGTTTIIVVSADDPALLDIMPAGNSEPDTLLNGGLDGFETLDSGDLLEELARFLGDNDINDPSLIDIPPDEFFLGMMATAQLPDTGFAASTDIPVGPSIDEMAFDIPEPMDFLLG